MRTERVADPSYSRSQGRPMQLLASAETLWPRPSRRVLTPNDYYVGRLKNVEKRCDPAPKASVVNLRQNIGSGILKVSNIASHASAQNLVRIGDLGMSYSESVGQTQVVDSLPFCACGLRSNVRGLLGQRAQVVDKRLAWVYFLIWGISATRVLSQDKEATATHSP